MLIDSFGREIDGLRLCITSRCNLDCFYCHNESQPKSPLCHSHPQIKEMDLDKIGNLIRACSELGIKYLKLTGGEPLLRRDVVEISRMASEHMEEVSLVTNATLLDPELGRCLANAGISRVNINLPGLDPEIYFRITRKNMLERALLGLDASLRCFQEIKLNFVYTKLNYDQLQGILDLAASNGIDVQIIELNALEDPELSKYHLSLDGIQQELSKISLQTKIRKLHSRRRYLIPRSGTQIWVELVPGYCNPEFCRGCRRIRVSADGKLKPCLMSDVEVDLNLESSSLKQLQEFIIQGVKLKKPYWS